MSILPCMKCKHSLCSSAPNLFCDKFHVVVDHRGGCGVGEPMVMTNADRIRAMTDEELAEEIIDCVLADLFRLNVIGTKPNTKEEWLEWLKEEVKE